MSQSLPPSEQMQLDPACGHSLKVTDGVLAVRLDDDDLVLTPGDSVAFPAGAQVRAWNAGDEEARVLHFAAVSGCPQALLLAA
jgi:quercetin dioxygenase-like cupin family protein